MKQLLKDYNADLIQLTADSQTLTSGSMMARRAVNTVITRLDQNPAYAIKLDKPNGLDFDHIILGKARVCLIITDDIAALTSKVGTRSLNRRRKL